MFSRNKTDVKIKEEISDVKQSCMSKIELEINKIFKTVQDKHDFLRYRIDNLEEKLIKIEEITYAMHNFLTRETTYLNTVAPIPDANIPVETYIEMGRQPGDFERRTLDDPFIVKEPNNYSIVDYVSPHVLQGNSRALLEPGYFVNNVSKSVSKQTQPTYLSMYAGNAKRRKSQKKKILR